MSLDVVLITGANRGIGLSLVRQVLTTTHAKHVIATTRQSSHPELDQLRDKHPNRLHVLTTTHAKHVIATTRQSSHPELDQLRDKHPNRLHVLQLEGTNYNSFPQFVKQVEAIVGDQGLDTLVNNAGIICRNGLDSVSVEDMMNVFEVNSVAPLMLTKALLPLLKVSATKRKTAVINITSTLGSISLIGQYPFRGYYPYQTSKAALNMTTKCLSVDLKPLGISVMGVHPGHVRTGFTNYNAAIDVDTSVTGILDAIRAINDELLGQTVSYDGSIIPY
ncbi:unnamed protein product [Oppiella nova]|uniref:NAD(P)-binding protein n=1 Tax=Oppiella nova TaxID=334625 RepID=A0A7R9MEC4_9ACAR|nr:unnamed protein product [Oppiella nova]CAG2175774.1 unnamed protein product [Oppiella nova]